MKGALSKHPSQETSKPRHEEKSLQTPGRKSKGTTRFCTATPGQGLPRLREYTSPSDLYAQHRYQILGKTKTLSDSIEPSNSVLGSNFLRNHWRTCAAQRELTLEEKDAGSGNRDLQGRGSAGGRKESLRRAVWGVSRPSRTK